MNDYGWLIYGTIVQLCGANYMMIAPAGSRYKEKSPFGTFTNGKIS